MHNKHKKVQATERNLAVSHEIPIIQQNENYFIEARLLHRKLKSKQDFTNWIKSRINDYGFKENEDFTINLSKSTGGRKAHEYLITLDTAKEISMLEKNDEGRSIRKFFIAKEKELRGISQLPKEAQLFKGLKAKHFNGRKMYAYCDMLERCGYKRTSNSGNRKATYWMHFVLDGKTNFITEEFALHLYHSRQVYNNRAVMKASKPVIPSLFGDVSLLNMGNYGK